MIRPSKYAIILNGLVIIIFILFGFLKFDMISRNQNCLYDGLFVACEEEMFLKKEFKIF